MSDHEDCAQASADLAHDLPMTQPHPGATVHLGDVT
jgi:hypothetical protein